MNAKPTPHRRPVRKLCGLATLLAALIFPLVSHATLLYRDTFESYPVQNPAPNPLTNGPAGGQWVFIDPIAPLTVNEHRIFYSSNSIGASLGGNAWGSATNNAVLSNSITIVALPPGQPTPTFRLAWVAASDTLTAGRPTTFSYAISSSAGTLEFVSGGNFDASQAFTNLNGTGLASSTVIGKSADRRFEVLFKGTGLSVGDKINFQITRVTNNTAGITFLLDDVELSVIDDHVTALNARSVLTLQNVRVAFSDPVDPQTATNTANYSFVGSTLTVQQAYMLDYNTVELQTTAQTPGSAQTLQLSGIAWRYAPGTLSTQLNFTVPVLASPVLYDAGDQVSMPAGPPAPNSPPGNNWVQTINTQPNMTTNAVLGASGENGGLNAWQISDNNATSSGGSLDYRTLIDQPSDDFARSNGWRLVLKSRLVDSFGRTAADQAAYYGDAATGLRYGVFLGLNADGKLFTTLLGGATFVVSDTTDAFEYHTHVVAFDPVRNTASYYYDGKLITANYLGNFVANINGVIFGSANSTGTGLMNYNKVSLDVVGATAPTVVRNPASSTNGVGQKVTFSAAFAPFVNSYQWLSNDVPIPGALSTTYTTTFISLANNGDQYKLRAFSALGNRDTAPATLSVTSDTNPPTVAALSTSPLLNRVLVTFSEPVSLATATDPANYTWNPASITTLSATQIDALTVELHITPLTAGTKYTLLLANIRDTSNLVITNGSSVAVSTFSSTPIARYYAGATSNAPSGPPDPISPEGGAWLQRLDDNTALTTNAIVDDQGTGLHAWQVSDLTTANNMFNYYYRPVTPQQDAAMKRFGWSLTVVAKILDGGTIPSANFAYYEDNAFSRYALNFGLDANWDLLGAVWYTNGFTPFTLTTGSSGTLDYHTHQVSCYPGSTTAFYYVDGQYVTNWPGGYVGPNSVPGVLWGTLASAPVGTMNFNLIDLSVVDGPLLSFQVNGTNLDVTYRGILEATPVLGSGATWLPVATNTAGTAVYPVSLQSPPHQFFRARMP